MPFTADRMRKMINLPAIDEGGDLLDLLNELVEGNPYLPNSHALNEPEHLFSRIPDAVIEQQIAKLAAADAANQAAAQPESKHTPLKDMIQFDDFAKLDLRTGTVTSAEKMEKSKKLLKLSVDLGFEQRTILSGIAEHFSPEEVVGRQVVIVANLAPRAMMGTESQGMVLMAEDAGGKLSFVSPAQGWPNGMMVK
jgi:methionyl-tRNA synthetase